MNVIPLYNIIKHIQIFTSIHNEFLFNTTLFCAWRHVSAAHTDIFRPAYNRTGSFYVRTIWDPTLFTYKVHVKNISVKQIYFLHVLYM